jgi:magnesium-protoporphyrin IX monomethyl ester (oxidative) cyclase
MDDNFTFKRDRIVEICNGIIQSGLKIRWNTPNGISINTLDEELLKLMKRSGCKSICVAIETGDEELRNKVIGKRLSDAKIDEVARSAAKVGIFVTAFYIIGMPGETRDKFERTLEQIVTLPLNGVAAAFANPLPGTKLYQDCIDNGWSLLGRDAVRDNALYEPFIITEDFSEKELTRREKEFYHTFIRNKFFTIIKDTLLMRNLLLYPPFLMRIVKDRLFRY